MQDRIAAVAAALADAKAELASTKKRHDLMVKMAKKKEAAMAKYMKSWTRKEIAKVEKSLKPKSRKGSR